MNDNNNVTNSKVDADFLCRMLHSAKNISPRLASHIRESDQIRQAMAHCIQLIDILHTNASVSEICKVASRLAGKCAFLEGRWPFDAQKFIADVKSLRETIYTYGG